MSTLFFRNPRLTVLAVGLILVAAGCNSYPGYYNGYTLDPRIVEYTPTVYYTSRIAPGAGPIGAPPLYDVLPKQRVHSGVDVREIVEHHVRAHRNELLALERPGRHAYRA